MLSILDRPVRLCDGFTRREWLRIGGLSWLGLSLPTVLEREGQAAGGSSGSVFGRARSCILIFLAGGAPQHETFDPKPDAPAEVRGPFQPIATTVPGIRFCELLPRTARLAHRLAVIRSLATNDNSHGSSAYWMYTGYKHRRGSNELPADFATDWPSIGSVVGKLRPSERSPFSSVVIPEPLLNNPGFLFAGQNGGFMGRGW